MSALSLRMASVWMSMAEFRPSCLSLFDKLLTASQLKGSNAPAAEAGTLPEHPMILAVETDYEQFFDYIFDKHRSDAFEAYRECLPIHHNLKSRKYV